MPPRIVTVTEEAEAEMAKLSPRDGAALRNAITKLMTMGEELGYPHTSAVQGAGDGLRELRPRAGSSSVRALYRRVGTRLVVAAIGPEAQADARGFRRAVDAALVRLASVEEE
jgi:hypothetical protein